MVLLEPDSFVRSKDQNCTVIAHSKAITHKKWVNFKTETNNKCEIEARDQASPVHSSHRYIGYFTVAVKSAVPQPSH